MYLMIFKFFRGVYLVDSKKKGISADGWVGRIVIGILIIIVSVVANMFVPTIIRIDGALETISRETFSEIYVENDRLRAEINQAYTESERLRTKILELMNVMDTLEEQVSSDNQNLGEYQTQVREYQTQITDYQNQIRDSQNQITDLENAIHSLNEEIDIFIARGEPPVVRNLDGSLPSIVSLRNITSISDNFRTTNTHRDNYQNEYTDVLYFDNFNRNFRTLLDGRFSRLRGTAFIAYGESNSNTTTLRFELDGRVVASYTMDRTTRPIYIDIDLSEGNELSIAVGGRPMIYFADFRLYP